MTSAYLAKTGGGLEASRNKFQSEPDLTGAPVVPRRRGSTIQDIFNNVQALNTENSALEKSPQPNRKISVSRTGSVSYGDSKKLDSLPSDVLDKATRRPTRSNTQSIHARSSLERRKKGATMDDDSSALNPLTSSARFGQYTSHEAIFEQTAERKKRFWDFMKGKDVTKTYDIFISYNHGIKPFALALYKTLKHTYKYSVFIDKQLETKQKLYSALDEALRNTQVVVCLVTADYARSRACCCEVSLAFQLGIPMIPIIVKDLPFHKGDKRKFWPPQGEMSLPFAPLLYIDFRNTLQDEKEMNEKLRELRARIDAELPQRT